MRFKEMHGHYPMLKAKVAKQDEASSTRSEHGTDNGVVETYEEKKASEEGVATEVRQIDV